MGSQLAGVKFGDTYMSITRYSMTAVTRRKTEIKISCEMQYHKGKEPWGVFKSSIEPKTYRSLKNNAVAVAEELQRRYG